MTAAARIALGAVGVLTGAMLLRFAPIVAAQERGKPERVNAP